jgi:hypothetical protein
MSAPGSEYRSAVELLAVFRDRELSPSDLVELPPPPLP